MGNGYPKCKLVQNWRLTYCTVHLWQQLQNWLTAKKYIFVIRIVWIKAVICVYLKTSGITNSHFHDDNLMATVLNLFAAGTDTTSNTLRWALLLVTKYPEIQGKKLNISTSFRGSKNTWSSSRIVIIKIEALHYLDQVQEELSRVIGPRQVQILDRKNLHFVNAVLHEIQRVTNIAPISVPRKTSQDVTFQGHFIKKVQLN